MALVTKSFSDIITFTRNSGATYVDSNGVLQTAGNNVPRLDYNPITLAAQGLLIEEGRTNSIRNNTMQGAVAGTPGTLPTSGAAVWNVSGLGTLTQQVVAVSTINGINYIDLRFSGTTSTTQLSIRCEPGGTGAIAAANGQTWSMSLWSAILAGGLTNINSYGYGTLVYDAAGAFLGAPFSNGAINTTSTLTRTQAAGTIATVGTAFIQPQIYLIFNSGVAIDITLRIGLPQLELGAFATSVIPTTVIAATRSEDKASVNTLSPWYNATEGTLYAEVVGLMPDTLSLNRAVAAFSDNTYNNMMQIYKAAGSASWGAQVVAGGGPAQASYLFAVYAQNNTAKISLAYQANNFNAAVNGTAGVTDTSGSIPTVNKLELRDPTGAGAGQPSCYLRRITYYPRRLSNAEIQALTV